MDSYAQMLGKSNTNQVPPARIDEVKKLKQSPSGRVQGILER